jgi:MoaA/NifB/PqqE/SkfB family radical SAM enzyme
MPVPRHDPSRPQPLDHPFPTRPHRVYFALTNHCNRACPWCSTCSSPRGNTWLNVNEFAERLPRHGLFQVQLEGGEPTIHPNFWEFVSVARQHPRCTHLVLCTNGVVLPRTESKLRDWLGRMGTPLTIKLSFNHHLLDHDAGLLDLAALLRRLCCELEGERQLVLNVRLRRGVEDNDRRVRDAVESAGLLPVANVFFLQRYGFAAGEAAWDPPAPVWHDFTLVNPDGQTFGPDLIARSEAMRVMR